jgi:hypothetical protein
VPAIFTMGLLVSINVGLPRDVEWKGEKVHTAIWKQPVQGTSHVALTVLRCVTS